MFLRQVYLEEIINGFNQLKDRIKEKSKLNWLDENIFLEDFLCKILNIIYKIESINTNNEKSNSEGIDLIDKANKIIIQISESSNVKKINETLNKNCMEKYSNENYNLKFIFLDNSNNLSKKVFLNKFKISFNPKEDIIDFSILIKKNKELENIEIVKKIYDLFIEEILNENKNIIQKESILSEIVQILSEKRIDNNYNLNVEKSFEINEKINFNKLKISKETINSFAPHCSYLNSIYEEYDKVGNNKSIACFTFINQEYCKLALKIINPDEIFFQLID